MDTFSTVGDNGAHEIDDALSTDYPRIAEESALKVPASSLEVGYFALPEMSLEQHLRETFHLGEFRGHLNSQRIDP